MKNEKFRKALNAYCEDHGFTEDEGMETFILDDHAYDNSIIGITDTGILVYDYAKMVEEYATDEGCDDLEAVEWIEYNTMRALPYMGERHPIVIQDTVGSIMDTYGEDESDEEPEEEECSCCKVDY